MHSILTYITDLHTPNTSMGGMAIAVAVVVMMMMMMTTTWEVRQHSSKSMAHQSYA